ncbi:glycoside-pentoside-hexuronide (GPH):cation symporter [Paraglaciecola aquimarina]|uniref:Glycoside-pentoside-hexuronide (GPH):cation symporter n=1 Tax=Paraglaciecola algarum TaxID=3050085 RepID=A0ABS9D401_9ALTE|nr:glycoside-pentoside-hexuronide (GPH):cation symporter [Paraglaciecola sp. G1-23]MCF2947485.1 glycoside-pentoside-hexuronide (GPH):cation symporter [Paraglaciecola sp. G1-23]
MESNVKLTTKEKLGYGLGDTGSNIVFQVVINFMMFFYTDVFGITAAAAGTLMLVVRIFDAVTDPLMGALADRTQTRWGRYRPFLIWVAIPYGLLAVLAFTTPDASDGNKLVYAYVTYTLMMTAYTAINIPYSALGGVLTSDVRERASIQSWRFAMAKAGGLIIAAATLPLVAYFGEGDEQLGFSLAMAVMAIFAVLCFVGCFAFTKERVNVATNNVSIKEDIGIVLSNNQWWIIAGVTFFLLITVAMRGGVMPYYVSYYLGLENLIGTFVTVSMIGGIIGALVSNWASKVMCKVKLMKLACIGIAISNCILFFVPADLMYIALFITLLTQFFHMMLIPMLFSTIPDTVDHSISQNGRGPMAMSFSGHLLSLKFGIAIGGALTGWLLAAYGYQANVEQTETSLNGIVTIFSASPAIGALICLALLQLYKLDDAWSKRLVATKGQ